MQEIKVLLLVYDLIVWFSPKISAFPRKYKYTRVKIFMESRFSLVKGDSL